MMAYIFCMPSRHTAHLSRQLLTPGMPSAGISWNHRVWQSLSPSTKIHVPDPACLSKELETVREALVATPPIELFATLQRDAEANSYLVAFLVRIGDADGGLLEVGHISQAHSAQEALR